MLVNLSTELIFLMHLNLWTYLRWRIKNGSRADRVFVLQLESAVVGAHLQFSMP